MSQPFLALNRFVNLSLILEETKFASDNVFDYLGKPLGEWIKTLVHQAGVDNVPVIQSDKVHPGAFITGAVFVGEGAIIEPTAFIQGPCYIGPEAEIRHGAYIRGNVYVGKKAVVGHTSEVKGSVLFDHAKAAHFAYVGDSILGYNVNLGAGTKLANLKLRGSEVSFIHPDTGVRTQTGLRKFGAILGDECETGCNSVLSPGSLLLPHTAVMPTFHYRGTLKGGIAGGR